MQKESNIMKIYFIELHIYFDWIKVYFDIVRIIFATFQ